MTNTEEAGLLDHYNNVAQYAPSPVLWFGLATNTTTPDEEAGTGITEPTNGSWARVSKNPNDFWSDAVVDTDGSVFAEQVQALEFTNYDGGGATITHIVEWNHPTATAATNVRRVWTLPSPITPVAGQTLRFEPCTLKVGVARDLGSVDVTLQDVDDTA